MRERTLLALSTEPDRFFFPQSNLRRMVLLLPLVLFWLLAGTNLWAEAIINLPSEFGAVVYQTQDSSPTQLFIIANSHRSMITGANGDDTLQAQIETFKICEWLIRRRQAAMLLPEGFFGSQPTSYPTSVHDEWLDSATLSRWLADTSSFVNAELLLHEQYGITLQQVEDPDLYRNVRDALLASQVDDTQQRLILDAQVESLQKRRSDAILRRATALSQSNSLNNDMPKSSILTIGLAHLDHILDFIESGQGQPPANGIDGTNLSNLPLLSNSAKRSVGITVIVPQSLIKNLPLELASRI